MSSLKIRNLRGGRLFLLPVKATVRSMRQGNEILRTIVSLHPINVMDPFIRQKLAAMGSLPDQAVLKPIRGTRAIMVRVEDADIAVPVNNTSALPSAISVIGSDSFGILAANDPVINTARWRCGLIQHISDWHRGTSEPFRKFSDTFASLVCRNHLFRIEVYGSQAQWYSRLLEMIPNGLLCYARLIGNLLKFCSLLISRHHFINAQFRLHPKPPSLLSIIAQDKL